MKTHRDGLTPGERAVLKLVRDNPDQLTAADIAAGLESTTASIKVMVTKLRHKGYKITSPRLRDRSAPRLGVPQTYRLDGEPRA